MTSATMISPAFCVGAVDKCNLLDGQKIAEGNVLIGLPSSGCHSNGFSLIRKVLLKDAKLDLHERYDAFGGKTLGEELLTPTKIYVKAIKHLLGKVDIKGMSHITGGGFYENVPRMLKEGQGVTIDMNAFPSKPIFELIASTGNIEPQEMCNVFNMGIGFILAVDQGRCGNRALSCWQRSMSLPMSSVKSQHQEAWT